jgi:hypothetical protein
MLGRLTINIQLVVVYLNASMRTDEAVCGLSEVIQRKYLALATQRGGRAWPRRYYDFLARHPFHLSSDQKPERVMTDLATKDVAASSQNQAFSAVAFLFARPGVERD